MMAMAAVSALLIGIGEIYVIGVDGDRLKETETLHLLGETAALFAVLFLTLSLIRRRAACALLLGAVSSFSCGCIRRSSRFSQADFIYAPWWGRARSSLAFWTGNVSWPRGIL